jgi:hypothetical protein
MTEWMSKAEADRMVDEAMGMLDKERGKLAELGKVWEEQNIVWAKDQSLTMTFDGRGELLDLTFKGTKYRTMAPAQLAHTIMDTLRRGREETAARVTEVMGEDAPGGLDIAGLTSGKISPLDMVNELIGPMMRGFDGAIDQILPGTNSGKSGERKSHG